MFVCACNVVLAMCLFSCLHLLCVGVSFVPYAGFVSLMACVVSGWASVVCWGLGWVLGLVIWGRSREGGGQGADDEKFRLQGGAPGKGASATERKTGTVARGQKRLTTLSLFD